MSELSSIVRYLISVHSKLKNCMMLLEEHINEPKSFMADDDGDEFIQLNK